MSQNTADASATPSLRTTTAIMAQIGSCGVFDTIPAELRAPIWQELATNVWLGGLTYNMNGVHPGVRMIQHSRYGDFGPGASLLDASPLLRREYSPMVTHYVRNFNIHVFLDDVSAYPGTGLQIPTFIHDGIESLVLHLHLRDVDGTGLPYLAPAHIGQFHFCLARVMGYINTSSTLRRLAIVIHPENHRIPTASLPYINARGTVISTTKDQYHEFARRVQIMLDPFLLQPAGGLDEFCVMTRYMAGDEYYGTWEKRINGEWQPLQQVSPMGRIIRSLKTASRARIDRGYESGWLDYNCQGWLSFLRQMQLGPIVDRYTWTTARVQTYVLRMAVFALTLGIHAPRLLRGIQWLYQRFKRGRRAR